MGYGCEEIDMQNYLKAGEKRALNLSNRGPIRFNKDGTLHKKIIDSYSKNGFYIFEKVFSNDFNYQYSLSLRKNSPAIKYRFGTALFSIN